MEQNSSQNMQEDLIIKSENETTIESNNNQNTTIELIQNTTNNTDIQVDLEKKISSLQNKVTQFLKDHTIYEAIPEDMKILVFNDELLIKDSIEAMIKEDIYCGLLYNSKENIYHFFIVN